MQAVTGTTTATKAKAAAKTEKAKAAPITIVCADDGHTDAIPPLPTGFEYLENGYAKCAVTHIAFNTFLC